MTDKQFSVLREAITGAALFIGGAVLFLESESFGVLSMIAGGVFLLKDYLIAIYRPDGQASGKTGENEEQANDTH